MKLFVFLNSFSGAFFIGLKKAFIGKKKLRFDKAAAFSAHALNAFDCRFNRRVIAERSAVTALLRADFGNAFFKLFKAGFVFCVGTHNRNAKKFFKLFGIDFYVLFFCLIGKIQADNRAFGDLKNLQNKRKTALKRCAIANNNNAVAFLKAKEIPCNRLLP